MTKLDCSVTGCMHNAENCCCKNTILVEGKTAQDKCDTCCASTRRKAAHSATFLKHRRAVSK